LERSPALAAAVLAVLQAGAAYVALDPRYPAERLRVMLADSGAALLVTQEALLSALPPFEGAVLLLDREGRATAEVVLGEVKPPRRATPEDLAYVLYTSGSTGRPK